MRAATVPAAPGTPVTDDSEFVLAVAETLGRDRGRPHMTAFRWRRSPYATTHTLLEAEADLADGSTLPLALKRIDATGSFGGCSEGKPAAVYDGMREALVYRTLLADREPAAPFLYGVVRSSGATGGSWLLLERIRGRELYQFEAIARWEEVAGWLARFHVRGRSTTRFQVACRAARLLNHTRPLLQGWHTRACRFAEARSDDGMRRALRHLAEPFRQAVDVALGLPRTLIHGDFYPSNILLEERRGTFVVRPVDWELAGVGPGLFDLAALTAGDWNEPACDRIVSAYREATLSDGHMDRAAFESSLTACRLIIAVQWLGWDLDWVPPPEHRTDWLTAALNAAALFDMGPR